LLLVVSNVFMTLAWYGHLKFKDKPICLVIVSSWGFACFEYLFQVLANRVGSAEWPAAAKSGLGMHNADHLYARSFRAPEAHYKRDQALLVTAMHN
jgi:Putative member of DMT superfamily (DUF486)